MLAARAASALPMAIASARCSRAARPAAGYHRDRNGLAHGGGHLQVEAILRAVGIHAGEHDLAGPEPFDPARPFDRLEPGANPPAVDVDFPKFLPVAIHSLRVDIHHDTLAAEPQGRRSERTRDRARRPS